MTFSLLDGGQNVELQLLNCCVVRNASHQTSDDIIHEFFLRFQRVRMITKTHCLRGRALLFDCP